MFYHQLMSIDDIYLQQEYLLNEQENDKDRIYTESTKESLQQTGGSTNQIYLINQKKKAY